MAGITPCLVDTHATDQTYIAHRLSSITRTLALALYHQGLERLGTQLAPYDQADQWPYNMDGERVTPGELEKNSLRDTQNAIRLALWCHK